MHFLWQKLYKIFSFNNQYSYVFICVIKILKISAHVTFHLGLLINMWRSWPSFFILSNECLGYKWLTGYNEIMFRNTLKNVIYINRDVLLMEETSY